MTSAATEFGYEEMVTAIRNAIFRIKEGGIGTDQILETSVLWDPDDSSESGSFLALDSLDVLELLVTLEEDLGVVLPDEAEELESVRTVGELAASLHVGVPVIGERL